MENLTVTVDDGFVLLDPEVHDFRDVLSSAVTFGALMFGVTGGAIGATEMLVATAFCGVICWSTVL